MKRDRIPLLFSRPRQPDRSVLSAYLNVDRSQPARLNRKLVKQFQQLAVRVERSLAKQPDLERFLRASRRVQDFLETCAPSGAAIVVFNDESDGFFWHAELQLPVPDRIRWDRELLLQPLTNALDELEDYAVVLTDRTKLRVFMVRLGMVQELVHQELSDKRVRHVKATGTDRAESSSRIQRKADNQVRANLREVARQVAAIAEDRQIGRLILAGSTPITAELHKLLPKDLASLVIGNIRLPMDASGARVLSASRPVAEQYESGSEIEKVNRLVTAASKGGKTGKAVVGLERTLRAVNSGRVWELIYSGDFLPEGYECRKCFALFSVRKSPCPYCGSGVSRASNIVERAIEHALRKRAKVEVVTGDASTALAASGGIGAFLRVRTAPAEV